MYTRIHADICCIHSLSTYTCCMLHIPNVAYTVGNLYLFVSCKAHKVRGVGSMSAALNQCVHTVHVMFFS